MAAEIAEHTVMLCMLSQHFFLLTSFSPLFLSLMGMGVVAIGVWNYEKEKQRMARNSRTKRKETSYSVLIISSNPKSGVSPAQT
jgi:uncharacterized membrane protein YidH (DUF202 family)